MGGPSVGLPFETLGAPWRAGVRPGSRDVEEPLEVRWYGDDTVVLRQSKTRTFEAPFLFLLFGEERALLLDTGAVADPDAMPLRATVDALIDEWLRRRGEQRTTEYELVVAHTHGHGDHVAGDPQFADRPSTTVVGRAVGDVREFFGFRAWPDEVVDFDIGGRRLELIASPGHHPAAVTTYDPTTGFLLTGDTIYPGRLYAPDFPAFVATLERLTAFRASRGITALVGCHIEMSRRPGKDYPVGALHQPDEAPLPMPPDRLTDVLAAARSVSSRPGAHAFAEYAIYHGPCQAALARQLLRGKVRNGVGRLASIARR
jgi:glyoxylase-like metal-dependent hydrolase (beta-lactamase superfamily II)